MARRPSVRLAGPKHSAALLLALTMAGASPSLPARAASAAGTPPAMSLELPTLDGERFVSLRDFESRPVLINFWGSECPPCAREVPLLNAQAAVHPSVQFLGIAVDERSSALQFTARFKPSHVQLWAPRQPDALMRRFGNKLGALPYTVLLDAQHRVCASRVGELDANWLREAVGRCQ